MKYILFALSFFAIMSNGFAQSNEVIFPKGESIKIDELNKAYLKVCSSYKFETESIIASQWYKVSKFNVVSEYKPIQDFLGVLLFRYQDTKLVSTEAIKINPEGKYITLEMYEPYQINDTIRVSARLFDKKANEVYLDCFSYDLKSKMTSIKRLLSVKKGTDIIVYKDKSSDRMVCLKGEKSFLNFSSNLKKFDYYVFNKHLDIINQGENISMQNPSKQEAIAMENGDLIFCNMINNSLSKNRAYKIELFRIVKNEAKEISFSGEPYMSNAKFMVDDGKLKMVCLSKKSPLNIFNSILIGDIDDKNVVSNIKISNFKDLSSQVPTDENDNDKNADGKFEKIKDNEICNLPRMTCIMDIIYDKGKPTIFIDRVYEETKKAEYTTYIYTVMGYGALLSADADNGINNYAVLKYSATFSDLTILTSPCKPKKLPNGKFLVNKDAGVLMVELDKKKYPIGGFAFSTTVPDFYFNEGKYIYKFTYDWTKENVSLTKKDLE